MILVTYMKYILDMTYYIDIDFCYGKLSKNITECLQLRNKVWKSLFCFSFINTPFDAF